MEIFEVAPVHFFLNVVSPFVAVTAKHRVAVALLAVVGIGFGITRMLGNPARLVALRFWKSGRMAEFAILGGGNHRLRTVVAFVASDPVHFFAITVGIVGGVTRFT